MPLILHIFFLSYLSFFFNDYRDVSSLDTYICSRNMKEDSFDCLSSAKFATSLEKIELISGGNLHGNPFKAWSESFPNIKYLFWNFLILSHVLTVRHVRLQMCSRLNDPAINDSLANFTKLECLIADSNSVKWVGDKLLTLFSVCVCCSHYLLILLFFLYILNVIRNVQICILLTLISLFRMITLPPLPRMGRICVVST